MTVAVVLVVRNHVSKCWRSRLKEELACNGVYATTLLPRAFGCPAIVWRGRLVGSFKPKDRERFESGNKGVRHLGAGIRVHFI
jgi:hypothetical protein